MKQNSGKQIQEVENDENNDRYNIRCEDEKDRIINIIRYQKEKYIREMSNGLGESIPCHGFCKPCRRHGKLFELMDGNAPLRRLFHMENTFLDNYNTSIETGAFNPLGTKRIGMNERHHYIDIEHGLNDLGDWEYVRKTVRRRIHSIEVEEQMDFKQRTIVSQQFRMCKCVRIRKSIAVGNMPTRSKTLHRTRAYRTLPEPTKFQKVSMLKKQLRILWVCGGRGSGK